MSKLSIYIFCFIFFICIAVEQSLAQQKMGDNPTSIDNGSLLELESTNKAFIPPRVSSSQMNSIPTPLVGAIVYNTTENCLFQYRYINGENKWVSLCQPNETIVVYLENDFSGNIGGLGSTVTLNGIQGVNTLNGAYFNNWSNTILLPSGTYLFSFVYEGSISGGSSFPIVSSYFFDFPGSRIHSNQVHNPGAASNHGGTINYTYTLTSPTYIKFHIGRGQGGNWTGISSLAAKATYFSATRILK